MSNSERNIYIIIIREQFGRFLYTTKKISSRLFVETLFASSIGLIEDHLIDFRGAVKVLDNLTTEDPLKLMGFLFEITTRNYHIPLIPKIKAILEELKLGGLQDTADTLLASLKFAAERNPKLQVDVIC